MLSYLRKSKHINITTHVFCLSKGLHIFRQFSVASEEHPRKVGKTEFVKLWPTGGERSGDITKNKITKCNLPKPQCTIDGLRLDWNHSAGEKSEHATCSVLQTAPNVPSCNEKLHPNQSWLLQSCVQGSEKGKEQLLHESDLAFPVSVKMGKHC